jgi:hypothetical protein
VNHGVTSAIVGDRKVAVSVFSVGVFVVFATATLDRCGCEYDTIYTEDSPYLVEDRSVLYDIRLNRSPQSATATNQKSLQIGNRMNMGSWD